MTPVGLRQDQQFYPPQRISYPSQPLHSIQLSTPSSRFSHQSVVKQRHGVCWPLSADQSGLQLKSPYGFDALDSAREIAGTMQRFQSHPGSFSGQTLQGMQAIGMTRSNGSRVYEMNVESLRQKMAQNHWQQPLNPRKLSQPLHQHPSKGLQEVQFQLLQQQQSQAFILQQHQQLQRQKMPENTSSLTGLGAHVTASDVNKSGGGLWQEAKAADEFLGERETHELVHEVDLCGDVGPEIQELLERTADDFFDNVDTWENLDFDAEDPFAEIADGFIDIQQLQQLEQELQALISQPDQQPELPQKQDHVLQQEHILQQHQLPELSKIQERVWQQPQRLESSKVQEHGGQNATTLPGSGSYAPVFPKIILAKVLDEPTKQLLGKRKTQELQQPQLQTQDSKQCQELELPKTLHSSQNTVSCSTKSQPNATKFVSSKVSSNGTKVLNHVLGKRKTQLPSDDHVKHVCHISALFGSSWSMPNDMSKQVLGGDVSTRPLMSSSLGLKQLLTQSTDSEMMNKKRRV